MKKYASMALWAALAALLLAFATEALGRLSAVQALAFCAQQPARFAYNAFLIFATLSPAMLFRRRTAVFVLLCGLWLAVGVTNAIVIAFRSVPFSMVDVLLLPEAVKLMGTYFTRGQAALLFAGAFVLVALVAALFVRAKKQARVPAKYSVPSVALLAFLAALSIFLGGKTGWLDTEFENVIETYEHDGFAYCFLYTFADLGMEEPEDYSPQAADALADALEASPEPESALRPNIIFLQLESFMDPDRLVGVKTAQEAVPTFTRLKEEGPSGSLYMPMVGGGTANCEFEVLTGMNTDFFGVGEYPYNTIVRETACESIAFNLKEYGYSSHFIHNFSGSFYSRHEVLPQLGFDDYDSVEYMPNVSLNALDWPKDDVLAGEVLRALDNTPGRDFVFVTTMQGHGPYPEEPICETPIAVEVNDERLNSASVEYYVNQLCETDAFVGELLAALEAQAEPTVVLVYGDHLPALSLEADMIASGDLFESEYALWANFPLDAQDQDMEAYRIAAYVMGLFDLDAGYLTKLTQQSAQEADYLEQMELLQYDMLYGEGGAFEGENPYQPTQMAMGLRPIRALRAYFSGGDLVVEGENFTLSSQVFAGEEALATEFVSAGRLVVRDCALQAGESVRVCQVSREAIALSQTEDVTIADS